MEGGGEMEGGGGMDGGGGMEGEEGREVEGWRCSAAKQKIRPKNLKIRLLSDHISTKIEPNSGPKLAI